MSTARCWRAVVREIFEVDRGTTIKRERKKSLARFPHNPVSPPKKLPSAASWSLAVRRPAVGRRGREGAWSCSAEAAAWSDPAKSPNPAHGPYALFTAAAAVFTASVIDNVCVCVCVAVLCRFTSPVTSHVYEQC